MLNPSVIRRIHGYAGALFAPAILFFAATGVVQVFDLHHPKPWRGYAPPPLVRTLATLHKDQMLQAPPKPPKPPKAGRKPAEPPQAPPPMRLGQVLMKAYATATAAALVLLSGVGLYLALRNRRERPWTLALVAVGVLIPLLLLLVR